MEKFRAKKVGTLVYVSNGAAKYYGFFKSIEHASDGDRITIEAAIPLNFRLEGWYMNKHSFKLREVTIWKCVTFESLTAKEKDLYLNKLIELSRWNSDYRNTAND